MIDRTTYRDIWNSLSSEKQMIFLSGPRQTGKTTFARSTARSYANSLYFNWDILSHKGKLIQNPAFFTELNRKDSSQPLIIFDEIHKYNHWKNYLKGIYDEFSDDYKFLVSGSGRLDLYQRSGDSLAGRYFHMHMFPFTISELSKSRRQFQDFRHRPLDHFDISDQTSSSELIRSLLATGGFPEPFTKGTTEFCTRWSDN